MRRVLILIIFLGLVVPAQQVHAEHTGKTFHVSPAERGGPTTGWARTVAISRHGRFVAFSSKAADLVPGDTNRFEDVFVRDRASETTERVSISTAGRQGFGRGTGDVDIPYVESVAISATGRFVAFSHSADGLAQGSADCFGSTYQWRCRQTYVHDRAGHRTEQVSLTLDGRPTRGDSRSVVISASGRYVAYVSSAPGIVAGDDPTSPDVFVYDTRTRRTEVASFDPDGQRVHSIGNSIAISGEGKLIAFVAEIRGTGTALVVFDRASRRSRVVVKATEDLWVRDRKLSMSADGRFIAFDALRGGYATVVTTNISTRKSRAAAVSTWGTRPNRESQLGSISADGRIVVFESSATNLVPGVAGACRSSSNSPEFPCVALYAHDMLTGGTIRVSGSSDGHPANGHSTEGAVSGDGRAFAFVSEADNLGVRPKTCYQDISMFPCRQVYVHEESVHIHRDLDAPEATIAPGPAGSLLAPDSSVFNADVSGTATDSYAGIDFVDVLFVRQSPQGNDQVVHRRASLKCTDWSHRTCGWVITAPESGAYEITATAFDRARNVDPTPARVAALVVHP